MTSPSNSGPDTPVVAARGAGFCAACGARLSVDARFCHRCGTPFGEGRPRGSGESAHRTSNVASILPWGVSFVALLVLVANAAGKNFGGARVSIAANDPIGSAPTLGAPPAAPPNITTMSPRERASRLYIRMANYAETGRTDSIQFFAPMAMASHEMLTNPTVDERFHYGRIAEMTGNADVARAQADTILAARPTSLLGLVLAASAARLAGDETAARTSDRALLASLSAERATRQVDYDQHRLEIDRAVANARKRQ